jgi:hypothetical protein
MAEPDPAEAEVNTAFERVLNRALNSQQIRVALDSCGGILRREQLRTRALEARDTIAAAAAVEYRAYIRTRTATTGHEGRPNTPGGEDTGAKQGGLRVLAVLVPGLAAVTAAVFLVYGLALRASGAAPYRSAGLVLTGFVAAAVAVGAAVGHFAWFLFAAAERSATARSAPDGGGPKADQAWEAWQAALLDRGILPFLLGRLDEARTRAAEARTRAAGEGAGRPVPGGLPRAAGIAGRQRDDTPGPADGRGVTAPEWSSPDAGGPDFAGPDSPGGQ